MNETSKIRQLMTVSNTALQFAPAGVTQSVVRAHIFKAEDRFKSRGERIAGNGLAATGAIIRVGRKILIDVELYGAWLAGGVK